MLQSLINNWMLTQADKNLKITTLIWAHFTLVRDQVALAKIKFWYKCLTKILKGNRNRWIRDQDRTSCKVVNLRFRLLTTFVRSLLRSSKTTITSTLKPTNPLCTSSKNIQMTSLNSTPTFSNQTRMSQ